MTEETGVLTSPVIDASELALHLNLVEIDGSVRGYLDQLSRAAQASIFSFTGDFATLDPPQPVPEPVKLAIMQLAAHFYAFRETASTDRPLEIPFGVWDLIAPYRQYAF